MQDAHKWENKNKKYSSREQKQFHEISERRRTEFFSHFSVSITILFICIASFEFAKEICRNGLQNVPLNFAAFRMLFFLFI